MEENDALSVFDGGEDWNHDRRKILYQEVVCFFKQCSVHLLSFEDVWAGLHLGQKIRSDYSPDMLSTLGSRIANEVGRLLMQPKTLRVLKQRAETEIAQ